MVNHGKLLSNSILWLSELGYLPSALRPPSAKVLSILDVAVRFDVSPLVQFAVARSDGKRRPDIHGETNEM